LSIAKQWRKITLINLMMRKIFFLSKLQLSDRKVRLFLRYGFKHRRARNGDYLEKYNAYGSARKVLD